MGPLQMAENNWVSLGWKNPTFIAVISPPFINGIGGPPYTYLEPFDNPAVLIGSLAFFWESWGLKK